MALAAAAFVIAPQRARSQTVGGEIVGLASRKPVHGASVALVDDSANIVSSAAADTANGMFFIDAPHAGHYRVAIFVPGGSFVSPGVQLDSARTVEWRLSVPDVPGAYRNAYFAQDVTTPAQLIHFLPAPAYPEYERRNNTPGLVVAMFVVDEHGHPDPGTLQILNDAGRFFSRAVRESIGNAVYMPATKDGESVRQVVQLSIGFGTKGKTPNADVMVTALGMTRPAAIMAESTEVIDVLEARPRNPGNPRP